MDIWFKWKCKVIKGDHDGYCSGAVNEETISYDIYYCKYEVSDDEYYTLIWINNECPKIFNLTWFIYSTEPYIENIKTKIPLTSDCCYSSRMNYLCHEIMTKPIKIVEFIINEPDVETMKNKYLINISHRLSSFLKPILDKNNAINECFENILLMEIIDIILKFMWCRYVEDNII